MCEKTEDTNSVSFFRRHGYVVLKSFLPRNFINFSTNYVLKQVRLGHLRSGDLQVKNTPCAYGDPLMDTFLEKLRPQVEMATGAELFPTYSYFRVYKRGDLLEKHKDRPACEISVSINLCAESSTVWTINLESASKEINIHLNPGDALIYLGCEIPHWREVFTGTQQAQIFLHYVDRNGKFSDWKFDKRPRLSGFEGADITQLLLCK
jgi:hypothetical protein